MPADQPEIVRFAASHAGDPLRELIQPSPHPKAAFITGTDLLIDGGATAWHVNGPGYARGSTPGGAGDLETAVGGVSPAPFGRRG